MMKREELLQAMTQRQLKMGEILSHGYALMSNRFGSYLWLSVLVFLPVNALLAYSSMNTDLSALLEGVETTEDILSLDMDALQSQLIRVLGVNMAGLFLSLVAILVSSVIIKNQLLDPKNHPFGTSFYRGIRMWPRAALTEAVLMLEFGIAILGVSMLMMIPLLGLIALPLLGICILWFIMNETLCGVNAALRGRMGFDNLHYVRFLLQGQRGKALGQFALIILISEGISLLVSLATSNIFSISQNEWVQFGLSVGLSTLVSILNTFGYVCGTLIFLNLEELKKTRLRKVGQNGESELQINLATHSLQAMEERERKMNESENEDGDSREESEEGEDEKDGSSEN